VERSLKLSWIGPLVVVIALVLSAIACNEGQPGTTPSPTTSEPAAVPPAPVTSPPGAGPSTETAMVSLRVVVQPQGAAEIVFDPMPYGVDSFPRNSTVTITVSPQPGWRLKEWAGPAYKVVGNVAKVFTNNPHTVSVLLERDGSSLHAAPTPGVVAQTRPTVVPVPTPPTAPTPTPTPVPAPVPAPDYSKIFFASDRDDGYGEIYVMDVDGSNQTRLTDSPAWSGNPSWSPGG